LALPLRVCLDACSRSCLRSASPWGWPCAAPHPHLRLTGARRCAAPRV